jgi:type IV pilus assembly protein PilO
MGLIPKTQREQVLFLLIFVSLAGLGGYYQYVFSPKGAEITAIEEHLEKLNVANQKAKIELGKGTVEELRAQAARYQANLVLMRQLVPTSNEVPALLEQVSTAARRVGLDLSEVAPSAPVRGETFDTYRYKLRVSGEYHELAAFLTNVGSLTRIVAPINLKLAPSVAVGRSKSKTPTSASRLDAEFEIQTYVAKAGTEPAPGA